MGERLEELVRNGEEDGVFHVFQPVPLVFRMTMLHVESVGACV